MIPDGSSPHGLILDIQRCSLHDGPGIRTTVFFKGCPLHCTWCHNPAALDARPQLAFIADRCVHCGACVAVCPEQAHAMVDVRHVFHRERCRSCGACVAACTHEALRLEGCAASVEEVMAVVRRDRPYYEASGGGLTLSGGEPLLQWRFAAALLAAARAEGIHTCVETSGFAAPEHLEAVRPHLDLLLIDLKLLDDAAHRRHTGVSTASILDNLRRLDAAGLPSILRCPIIPGVNDDPTHLEGIAAVAGSLRHVREINLLPYNPYGADRYRWFGLPVPLENTRAPSSEDLIVWEKALAAATSVPVRRS